MDNLESINQDDTNEVTTIEIPGESSVDWQATAMQYIELNKQKTEAIKRVRELHKPIELLTDYGKKQVCQECHEVAGDRNRAFYPCYTIKALDGDQS